MGNWQFGLHGMPIVIYRPARLAAVAAYPCNARVDGRLRMQRVSASAPAFFTASRASMLDGGYGSPQARDSSCRDGGRHLQQDGGYDS